jgi:hypothetical protein
MIEIVKQCPPVDAQGKPRVDSEGLLLLNECVNEAPDTKRMHSTETTDEEGNKVLHYTA